MGEDGRERMKKMRCVLVRPTSEGVVEGRRIEEKKYRKIKKEEKTREKNGGKCGCVAVENG